MTILASGEAVWGRTTSWGGVLMGAERDLRVVFGVEVVFAGFERVFAMF